VAYSVRKVPQVPGIEHIYTSVNIWGYSGSVNENDYKTTYIHPLSSKKGSIIDLNLL
jgi:hypothetical protein